MEDREHVERFKAELDQLDAEIVELEVRVKHEVVVLDTEEEDELEQVYEQLADAQEKCRQVADARGESLREMEAGLRKSMDSLKQTWRHARERVEAARHG